MAARPLPHMQRNDLAAVSAGGVRHSGTVRRLRPPHRRNLADTGRRGSLFSSAGSCSHGLANHVVAGCLHVAWDSSRFSFTSFRTRKSISLARRDACAWGCSAFRSIAADGLDTVPAGASARGTGFRRCETAGHDRCFSWLFRHLLGLLFGCVVCSFVRCCSAGLAKSSRFGSHSIWKLPCRGRDRCRLYRQARRRVVPVELPLAQNFHQLIDCACTFLDEPASSRLSSHTFPADCWWRSS